MKELSICESAVYDFLLKTNRPQGSNEIIGIFSGQYKEYMSLKKPAILSALESLSEEKAIVEKIYGKQKVYVINQLVFKDKLKSSDDLAFLKQEVDILGKQMDDLHSDHKRLKNEENRLKESYMSIDEVNKQLDEVRSIVHQYEAKLSAFSNVNKKKSLVLSSKTNKPVAVSELKKRQVYYMSELKKRRKIFIEIIDTLMEHYPKTKNDLFDQMGLDVEDVNRYNEKFKELNKQ